MAKKVIVAYLPVFHQGYARFFDEYPEYRTLYILGSDIISGYRHLQKEIRALSPEMARKVILGLDRFDSIQVVSRGELAKLKDDTVIVMPDDEVSHDLADGILSGVQIEHSPIFLRWDRRRSNEQDTTEDEEVSLDEADRMLMQRAYAEGNKSSNIWRRVGAVLVKDGAVISYASNKQRPSEHSSWIDGDVRSNFGKGVGIEMSTDQHAESCVIADAARRGIALEGADLYVTTFPCPPCSMLIAYSGIKRVFYAEGYAVLDGRRVLEDQGVKLYKVNVPADDGDERAYVPYPEK